MKLVRQTRLSYAQGRSDKVYEVDLCHIKDDDWVVNFRYGRRGATLRDGTKTTLPVSREKAEKIFDNLVAAKKKKGYADAENPSPAPHPAPTPAPPSAERNARDAALLERLSNRVDRRYKRLDRTIWRVGELRLHDAVPMLVRLADQRLSDLRAYCVAWALARCATPDDVAAREVVQGFVDDHRRSIKVRRIALQAVLMLAAAPQRAEMFDEIVTNLPAKIREAYETGEAASLHKAVLSFLHQARRSSYVLLEELYLLAHDHEHVHAAMLGVVAEAPMRPPWFRSLRHLYKAAELRLDARMHGALAHRFETSPAMVNNHGWYDYAHVGHEYVHIRNEIKSKKSRLGYTSKTRDYLRRRVARTMRKLGKDASPAYVPMAVGVLLEYSDADAKLPRSTSPYTYGVIRHFDAWAPYWALNTILFGGSPRYEKLPKKRAWHCRDPYRPGDDPPEEREEAFPELWDAQPQGLVHLLAESRAGVVHEFAVKALRANPEFCRRLDGEAVGAMLAAPYEITLRFALDLAREIYRPEAPDVGLVRALLFADLDAARNLAMRWIDANRAAFLGDEDFILDLIEAEHTEVRAFGMRLFGELTPDALRRHRRLILACILSNREDIREAVRPAALKLARDDEAFERDLANELLPFFLREEAHPGLHEDLAALFREALPRAIASLEEDAVWFLIASRFSGAGKLAEIYFERHVVAADLSFPQLARLAAHESLALRRFAWDGYGRRASYLPQQMPEALGILDVSWEDSRRFGMEYFREYGNPELWDPGLLVSVCDSTRIDVAAFGRELITKFFEEEDGPEYLQKLSQHPTSEMQVFATNYLERYASGNLEQIRLLRHYFVSVLARVGRGRVAKDRVLHFLVREALSDREVAVLTIEILARLSATIAIGDRAAAIAALRDIHRAWPDLDVPLVFTTPPRREPSSKETRLAL